MQKKRTRQQAKQLTRGKLLDIAEQALTETDFRASTLSIAQKASVAHGTIFFHFKNREELMLSVVRRLVLTVTEQLYAAYVDSRNLEEFLTDHFNTIRTHWRFMKALFSGFSNFNEEMKQEVIALLAVANYYLVESFDRWTNKGLIRTTAWQGTITYLSFFGDYMFEDNNLARNFIPKLIALLAECPPVDTEIRTEPGMPKTLCESCGMILHDVTDFAQQDPKSKYCRHCTSREGDLKDFDQVVETMIGFLKRTQVLSRESARKAALAILAKNPAWRQCKSKESPGKD
jgi:AcrR family transcriptional regulator